MPTRGRGHLWQLPAQAMPRMAHPRSRFLAAPVGCPGGFAVPLVPAVGLTSGYLHWDKKAMVPHAPEEFKGEAVGALEGGAAYWPHLFVIQARELWVWPVGDNFASVCAPSPWVLQDAYRKCHV